MEGSSAAPAGASAAVNANDPNSIITQALNGATDVKSFHIELTVAGTIKAAALSDSLGGSAAGAASDIKLDGMSIVGDVDVANKAGKLALTVPPIAALGNVPLSGDAILVNNTLYYRMPPFTDAKYTQQDLTSVGDTLQALSSALPASVPTALPSGSGSLTDSLAQIRAAMDAAGVKATLVGTEQIGGQDAYHISVSIPVDYLNSQIAAEASSSPAMKIDSASADFWVYTANSRLAKVEVKAASSTLGSIDVTVTVTNYDQPVTITAPPASDVMAPTS